MFPIPQKDKKNKPPKRTINAYGNGNGKCPTKFRKILMNDEERNPSTLEKIPPNTKTLYPMLLRDGNEGMTEKAFFNTLSYSFRLIPPWAKRAPFNVDLTDLTILASLKSISLNEPDGREISDMRIFAHMKTSKGGEKIARARLKSMSEGGLLHMTQRPSDRTTATLTKFVITSLGEQLFEEVYRNHQLCVERLPNKKNNGSADWNLRNKV
jgi:hypothetical protein